MTKQQTNLAIAGLLLLNIFLIGYIVLGKGSASQQTAPAAVVSKEVIKEYKDQAVKNTIVKNRQGLLDCYNNFLEKKPKEVNGSLKTDWQIQLSGAASSVGIIQNQLADEPLAACVSQEIATWEFPVPPGNKPFYVTHTFHFGEPPKREPPEMVNVK